MKPIDFLKRTTEAIKTILKNHRMMAIILLVFSLNIILVSPSLMPEINQINPEDESKYVDSGWRLLNGDIRELSWGPIVALVYAPVHLIVGNSPDWFMIENWAGRFILFSFLWWSFIYLTLQLKEYISPYIMVGVLFIATPFFIILDNPSDAVLLGFSVLALSQLIKYYHYKEIRYLAFCSVFIGLGILARVETIVILPILLILSLLINRGNASIIKVIFNSILPGTLVLSIYIISSFALNGQINLGMTDKSYDAFEVAQQVLTGGNYNLAIQESRQLFGTKEENNGSVIRAILRNPQAFALRVYANAKTIPDSYLAVFGKKIGPILLLFAVWGVFRLIRKKAFVLLGMIFAWSLFSLLSLGFFILHLIPQVSYLPLLLGAIGIAEIFDYEPHRRTRLIFFLTTLLLLIASWAIHKPAIAVGLLLAEIAFLLFILAQQNIISSLNLGNSSILLVFAIGLILREPFPFPDYPVLGASNQEQAIHYLERNFSSQSIILVPTPLPAIASKLAYITMGGVPADITSLDDFYSYLKQGDVQAIYWDKNRRLRNDLYDLFEAGYEQYFIKSYSSPDESIRIFSFK